MARRIRPTEQKQYTSEHIKGDKALSSKARSLERSAFCSSFFLLLLPLRMLLLSLVVVVVLLVFLLLW
jgi:hypothetical protein